MIDEVRERLGRLLLPDDTHIRESESRSDDQSRQAVLAHDGGVESQRYAEDGAPETRSADAGGKGAVDFEDEKLLNGIGLPVFMIDRDGEVIAWNERIERMTDVSAANAANADIKDVLYPEADISYTLAEMVRQAPETATEVFDVRLVDEALEIYELDRHVTEEDGKVYHYECAARPLYQDGELAAVLQTVQDRTDEVSRHEAVSDLVEELVVTFETLAAGNLEARAAFEDEYGVIDEDLLRVVEEVNMMADQLETLTGRVTAQTTTLAELGEQSAEAADRIDDRIADQRALLDEVGAEMEDFSANMEEVAASADEIASAAEQARNAAANGRQAGTRAREATNDVIESSNDLVETVSELEASVTDIAEVLEVIDEIAEQTNILALNASIEAARAGESGAGFEVVADEVKDLASETHDHTEEIATSVEVVQTQTEEMTGVVEASHAQIQQASEEIDEALTALDEIASAVEETATGIQEVADANDDQANTVQEVMGMLEDVRDRTDDVETARDQIVALIDEQQEEITELRDRVDSLSS